MGVLAAVLAEADGRFTGELQGAPVSGDEKARLAREWARERAIDLEASHAYGDSTADLALLRIVGHPVAVNPSRALRRIAEREGWTIESWRTRTAGPASRTVSRAAARARGEALREVKALLYRKSIPRYLLVRGLGKRLHGVATGALAPLALAEVPEPPLPAPDWVRVRPRLCGICGSDLATIRAAGSPYFSALTSFPFVLGHEVVGDVVEAGRRSPGWNGATGWCWRRSSPAPCAASSRRAPPAGAGSRATANQ